jgi:hypothetical protein
MSRTLSAAPPRRAVIAVLALVGAAALTAPAYANDMGPRLRGSPFLGSEVSRSRDIQNREEWYSRTHPLHVNPVIPNGYNDMETWYSQTHPLHVKPVIPPGYSDMEEWYSRTHRR